MPSQLYFKRAVMHICRLMEACVLKWVVGGLSGAEVGQVYLERNPDIHFRARRIMVNRGKLCGSDSCLLVKRKGTEGGPRLP